MELLKFNRIEHGLKKVALAAPVLQYKKSRCGG